MKNQSIRKYIIFIPICTAVITLYFWINPILYHEITIKLSSDSADKSIKIHNFIQYGLTILGFVVGFWLLIFQLNKQHKNNLILQRKQFKSKIHLEIFNEISCGINDTTSALVNIQGKLFAVSQKIDTKRFLKNEGIETKPLPERTVDFIDYHQALSNEIIKLVFILEKYLITDRIFEIFNMSLQASIYELGNDYHKVNDSLLKFLPVDVHTDDDLGMRVIEPRERGDVELEKLKNNLRNYSNNLINVTSYLHDLKIESQNILLGDIFDNKVNCRKIRDEQYVVISKSTTKSLDELEYYFMHETNWGKNWQSALKRSNSTT